MSNDISLIPTDELLKEVFVRFDNAVFVGSQVTKKGGINDNYGRMFKGEGIVCLGLLELMKSTIISYEASHSSG